MVSEMAARLFHCARDGIFTVQSGAMRLSGGRSQGVLEVPTRQTSLLPLRALCIHTSTSARASWSACDAGARSDEVMTCSLGCTFSEHG